jgi:hypothetical protein
MKNKWFAIIGALLGFGLLFSACDTGNGGEQDALIMSDYFKYVRPESEDWGDRLVTVYYLNPAYREEIITAFSNENRLVIDTYTRDWDLGKTVFRYVELVELKNGTNFCPRFLDYSASDSNSVTEYMSFDEPNIGDTFESEWDEGVLSIEYLGQKSPASMVFDEKPPFGRWMYPGYYKITDATGPYYRYCHIFGGSDGVEFTSWF